MNAPGRLVRSVLAWPVETQHGARRNALLASTELLERRREHDEVEEYLAALELRSREAATVTQSRGREVI